MVWASTELEWMCRRSSFRSRLPPPVPVSRKRWQCASRPSRPARPISYRYIKYVLSYLLMRYNNPAARGILGKMSAPSDSKNCPRTVDCAAVEVRGQFLESRGRTFFPVCRVLPGYYNIITRELRFLPYYTNRTCIMKNSTVIIRVLNTRP